MLSTPSGSPHSASIRPSSTRVTTASSGGLATTEHPAARAAAMRWLPVMSGPFQGSSSATTPAGSGRRRFSRSGPPPGSSRGGKAARRTSPCRSRAAPAAQAKAVAASWTSKILAPPTALPVSRASKAARRSASARMRAAAASSTSARCGLEARAHTPESKDRRAAATAASTSAGVASSQAAGSAPVEGSSTGRAGPSPRSAPSMSWRYGSDEIQPGSIRGAASGSVAAGEVIGGFWHAARDLCSGRESRRRQERGRSRHERTGHRRGTGQYLGQRRQSRVRWSGLGSGRLADRRRRCGHHEPAPGGAGGRGGGGPGPGDRRGRARRRADRPPPGRGGDRRVRLRGHPGHGQRPPAPHRRSADQELHPRPAAPGGVDIRVVGAGPRGPHRRRRRAVRAVVVGGEPGQRGDHRGGGGHGGPPRPGRGRHGGRRDQGHDRHLGLGHRAGPVRRPGRRGAGPPGRGDRRPPGGRAGGGLGDAGGPRPGLRRAAGRRGRPGPGPGNGPDHAYVAHLVGPGALSGPDRAAAPGPPGRTRGARPPASDRPRGVARRRRGGAGAGHRQRYRLLPVGLPAAGPGG